MNLLIQIYYVYWYIKSNLALFWYVEIQFDWSINDLKKINTILVSEKK